MISIKSKLLSTSECFITAFSLQHFYFWKKKKDCVGVFFKSTPEIPPPYFGNAEKNEFANSAFLKHLKNVIYQIPFLNDR